MSKSIKKAWAKFDLGHQFAKQMGLPDPMGDTLYGSERALSPTEKAEKAAKAAAEAAGSVTTDSVPVAVSDETLAAREAQKKRQLAAAGLSGTVLTGSQGLSAPATTSMKSLLGS
jgi:citrate lyase beta subunit